MQNAKRSNHGATETPPVEPDRAVNDSNDSNDSNDTRHIPRAVYDALPDTLSEVLRNIDERHERDVVLTALLPVFAGALPTARFKYGGMWSSLNLYTAVVAPAGAGKGKMSTARHVGNDLNQKLHEESERRLLDWQAEQEGDGDPGPRPEWKRLFIPADSSAAHMKRALSASPHGVIFETEFKTLSSVLRQDWGQFRDVLLKAFQNEPVEVGREKDERPTLIQNPALSVAVSGTPGTFAEVIEDTEDGLFSRFGFYRFTARRTWRSQIGGVEDTSLDTAKEAAAGAVQAMYHELTGRGADDPLYLEFTDEAAQTVDRMCGFLIDHWKSEGVRGEMDSSLYRAGLRAFRIGAILHLIEHYEAGRSLGAPRTIEVGRKHVQTGLAIALTWLIHSLQIAEVFGTRDDRNALNRDQRRYFDALPIGEFETSDAKEIAGEVGVNERTAQRWLKQWATETGLIQNVRRGVWERMDSEVDDTSVPGVISVISVISVIKDKLRGSGAGER